MTNWTPTWRISINGTQTSAAYILSDLNITNGRTTIFDQAQASYCSFNIIVLNSEDITIDINDTISVELLNSSATYIQIFGGTVSDIAITVAQVGTSAITQQVSVRALGDLSKMSRAVSTSVLASNYDGYQFTELVGALGTTWATAPVYTWATYVPITDTWASYFSTGTIDIPGQYMQAARASSLSNTYSTGSTIAVSGLGYMYEDGAGKICYGDSLHRLNDLQANGYIELDANQVLGQGLRTHSGSGDVRNSITVLYGAGSASSTSTTDTTSIALYGLLGYTVSGTCLNLADAQNQATFYKQILSYPAYNLDSITYPLGSPEITDALRNKLIDIYMGAPISVANLPANMGSPYLGFCEGFTFRASFNDCNLTLNLSPLLNSISAVQWQDVSVTEAYNTLSPTLDYAHAIQSVA
jgi:hypothetical protein